jgi:drug/metabolite transporter (DMT)-like permease
MAFLFLFFGMMCFGISNTLWRDLQLSFSDTQLLFYRSTLTIPMLLPICWIFDANYLLNPADYISSFLKAAPWIIISLLGLYLFIASIRLQASGISAAVVIWGSLFGTMLAFFIDDAAFPTNIYPVTILSIARLLLIDSGLFKNIKINKGTLLAMGAGLCWAIASRGFKTAITTTHPSLFALFQEIVVLIISFGIVFAQKKKSTFKYHGSQLKGLLTIALLTVGGIMGSNLAIASSNLMYFSMISVVQPATTVIVSKFIQKETISNHQITGAVLLIVAAGLN